MKDSTILPVAAFDVGEVCVRSSGIGSETVLSQHRVQNLSDGGFVCIAGVADDQVAFSSARFPVSESIRICQTRVLASTDALNSHCFPE